MEGLKNTSVYRGHARFIGPQAVEVNGSELTADRIFLDVGSRPLIPAIPGLDSVPYLTNVTMMNLDIVPEHLLVIGGGFVGLEFAQMMSRFGSRVTVVEMAPRLLRREDVDVSLAIQDFLRAEGIELRLDAKCVSVQKTSGGLLVGVDCRDGHRRASARTCCSRSAACPTPTTSASTALASELTGTVTSRLTEACAPQTLTSGRLATATVRARSRTLLTTTTKLLLTTCSRTPGAMSRTGFQPMPSTQTRRSAASV